MNGHCPVYKAGDSFRIADGFILRCDRDRAICLHSLASLMPYYVALSRGASPVELGLAREGEVAYVQCLDPCHLTGGGTVVFAVKRGHLQVSPVRIRQKKGPKRGHLQVSPLGRKKET
ncbi:MAG: TIGR04076 family protein [Candidatus Aminicenantes bacterium]|nr:TIGR04076 family protein [Candidatus Aminicenantes bacterium]